MLFTNVSSSRIGRRDVSGQYTIRSFFSSLVSLQVRFLLLFVASLTYRFAKLDVVPQGVQKNLNPNCTSSYGLFAYQVPKILSTPRVLIVWMKCRKLWYWWWHYCAVFLSTACVELHQNTILHLELGLRCIPGKSASSASSTSHASSCMMLSFGDFDFDHSSETLRQAVPSYICATICWSARTLVPLQAKSNGVQPKPNSYSARWKLPFFLFGYRKILYLTIGVIAFELCIVLHMKVWFPKHFRWNFLDELMQ